MTSKSAQWNLNWKGPIIIPTFVIIVKRLCQSFLNQYKCTDSSEHFPCFAGLDKIEWFSKWRFHCNPRYVIKAELAHLILILYLSPPSLPLSNSPKPCALPGLQICIGCFGTCNIIPLFNIMQFCVMKPTHSNSVYMFKSKKV